MGSVEDKRSEFTILVTGFEPFKSEYPQNPSWEIARQLPAYLPGREGDDDDEDDGLPPVRIVVFPEPIRVSYAVVRELVPKLWDGVPVQLASGATFVPPPRIDLLLHIGMAGPRLHYALERFGRRDGYAMRDVDGCLPSVESDSRWPWHGVPPVLASEVDLEAALLRWRDNVVTSFPRDYVPDLRLSVDAGRYLCDFIYFSSLAHLCRRARGTPADPDVPVVDPDARRRVTFLHVPASAAPERVAIGRTIAVELLRALATVEVRRATATTMEAKMKTPTKTETEVKTATEPAATYKWYHED